VCEQIAQSCCLTVKRPEVEPTTLDCMPDQGSIGVVEEAFIMAWYIIGHKFLPLHFTFTFTLSILH